MTTIAQRAEALANALRLAFSTILQEDFGKDMEYIDSHVFPGVTPNTFFVTSDAEEAPFCVTVEHTLCPMESDEAPAKVPAAFYEPTEDDQYEALLNV